MNSQRKPSGLMLYLFCGLCGLMVLMTAVVGVQQAGQIKDEFFDVTMVDSPLADIAEELASLQLEQTHTLNRALLALRLGKSSDYALLRENFNQINDHVNSSLNKGRDLAQRRINTANSPSKREQGRSAIIRLELIEQEQAGLMNSAARLISAMEAGNLIQARKLHKLALVQSTGMIPVISAFRKEIDSLAFESAEAVEGHYWLSARLAFAFGVLALASCLMLITMIRRLVLDLKLAQAEAERISTTDPMTGLLNRRQFARVLNREIHSASRHRHPLSLCVCDIDELKRVNEQWGQAAGDQVLRTFAEIIKTEIRKEDIAARFSEDEFALLLPHTPADKAVNLLERIRRATQLWRFLAEQGGSYSVTATFGVADLDPLQANSRALIVAANAAYYRAKQRGSNQVGLMPTMRTATGETPSKIEFLPPPPPDHLDRSQTN